VNIHYYKSKDGNLGDDLNAWMWNRLMPPELLDREDGAHMLGIGTIIGMPVPQSGRKIVFSSGVGYGAAVPRADDQDWRFDCVRGPLTARVLGLPAETAVTDGAILLASFDELKTLPSQREGVVFMPHISVVDLVDWMAVCSDAGVTFLNPRGDHFETLKALGRARLVLADAMHAAIICDALRVPWIALRSSSEISGFKWLDWTLSLDMDYAPIDLPTLSLAHRAHQLKSDFMISQYIDRRQLAQGADGEITALQAYIDHKALPKSHRMASILAKKAYASLGSPLLHSPIGDALIKSPAQPRRELTQLFKRLSHGVPGQISADAVFDSRYDEMRRRLDALVATEMELS
jgi:hypothetical protein